MHFCKLMCDYVHNLFVAIRKSADFFFSIRFEFLMMSFFKGKRLEAFVSMK